MEDRGRVLALPGAARKVEGMDSVPPPRAGAPVGRAATDTSLLVAATAAWAAAAAAWQRPWLAWGVSLVIAVVVAVRVRRHYAAAAWLCAHTYRYPPTLGPRVRRAQQAVARLRPAMGVDREVTVACLGGHATSSIRVGRDRGLVFVEEKVLALPVRQLAAILAHELAHLQVAAPTRAVVGLRTFVLPVALAASTLAGPRPVAAAVACVLTWAVLAAVTLLVARAEERRADAVSAGVCGADLAAALQALDSGERPRRWEQWVSVHDTTDRRVRSVHAALSRTAPA